MKLLIDGTAEFDPFGIPFLKHNTHVHQVVNLDVSQAGKTFSFVGDKVIIFVGVTHNGDELDIELKVAILGFPVLDEKKPLNSHLGVLPVKVGGPQLGFIGNIQISD